MLILNAGQGPLCSAPHLLVEVLLISNFQYLDVSCMSYIPRPGYISWDGYGPVRLQRFSQRMPTYEKLMQNVGIR